MTAEAAPSLLVPKGRSGDITHEVTLAEDLEAPVEQGQIVGSITFSLDGEELCEIPLLAAESVSRMDFWAAFRMLWYQLLS